MNLIRGFHLLVPVFAIAACTDPVRSDLTVAAGTYSLQSTIGRGAATGTVVLHPTGEVERRVRYRAGDGSLSPEYVAIGTFTLKNDDGLDLGLRENGGASPYVWKPAAALRDGTLTIEYPDAADGPNIIESYRKQ